MSRKRPSTNFRPTGAKARIVGEPPQGGMTPKLVHRYAGDGATVKVSGEPFPARQTGLCFVCSGKIKRNDMIIRASAGRNASGHAHVGCPGTTAAQRRQSKAQNLLGFSSEPRR